MKQVICLGKSSSNGWDSYQFVMWYSVTSGALTRSSGSVWNGANAGENAAIQNGSVLEEVENFTIPIGCSSTTIKDIAAHRWAVRNSQISGIGPNQYNGVYNDSVSGWSA